MEGEYRKLKASPSLKHIIEPGTVSREGSESELPRYTSLKDVLTSSMYGDNNVNDPTSNITIRNELVKHAASAYVLSATVISPAMNKDQEYWIPRIWERIKTSCLGFQSCWQVGVGFPVEALCRPVVELFYLLVHSVRNGLRGRVEILT